MLPNCYLLLYIFSNLRTYVLKATTVSDGKTFFQALKHLRVHLSHTLIIFASSNSSSPNVSVRSKDQTLSVSFNKKVSREDNEESNGSIDTFNNPEQSDDNLGVNNILQFRF